MARHDQLYQLFGASGYSVTERFVEASQSLAAVQQRYLRPTPKGVFNWLGKPEASLERRLFETLVVHGRETPFELRAIAQEMEVPHTALAKALFSLNRTESLSLMETEPDKHGKGWAGDGLAELSEVLALTAEPGQKLVLATHDGFQLARVGYGLYEADVLAVQHAQEDRTSLAAAPLSHVAALFVGQRWFVLTASSAIDRNKQEWVHLAYLLLSAFADTSPGAEKEGA